MSPNRISQLQALPLAALLTVFAGLPLVMVLALSFWPFDGLEYAPGFTLKNYADLFGSAASWRVFANTLRYAAITWVITLVIGFTVSCYLVFHIRNIRVQIALLLLCTIPFWTSGVIRTISWVPFLGREGLFNMALTGSGLTDRPLDMLLFSDFAVILTYVNLFALFMIVPIFNAMAKIDSNVIEVARDAGASSFQILRDIVIPLSRTGIALGSIFVLTLVMGDFLVVRAMSGGQSASVVSAMKNQIDQLYYPQAAAAAVLLIATVLLLVTVILRVVDVRAELGRQVR